MYCISYVVVPSAAGTRCSGSFKLGNAKISTAVEQLLSYSSYLLVLLVVTAMMAAPAHTSAPTGGRVHHSHHSSAATSTVQWF